MWVLLEAISDNFIETVDNWSSESLFIRKIFSPSPNFPHPKEDLSFFITASW
jgi:hypothetical protein